MEIKIQEYVALAPLTTFGIGGPARYLVAVTTEEQLQNAISWAHTNNVIFFILAGGSNVLFADQGFAGLVIKMEIADVVFDGDIVVAGAGATLLDIIEQSAQNNLSGWEKMAGIPGTIGGAARGNAGAFGTEIMDVLVSLRALNIETEQIRTFTQEECKYGYRDSFFKHHSEWIILSVNIQLQSGVVTNSQELIKNTIAEREKRHLQNVRAAGSFFMNPVVPQEICAEFMREKDSECRGGRVPAGWLIDNAGMKGECVGDACCSSQHPNYIVNTGNASAEDIMILSSRIKQKVRTTYHVQLKEEVVFVGF